MLVFERRVSFLQFLEDTPDVVLTVNQAGYVEYVNPAAARALGRSANELQARRFVDFSDDPSRDKADRLLQTLRLGQTVTDFELNHALSDGRVVGMTYTAFPLRADHEMTELEQGLGVLVGRPLAGSLEIVADVVASNERLRAILAVMAAGRDRTSDRDIAIDTVDVLSSLLTVQGAAIFLIEGGSTLVRVAPIEASPSDTKVFNLLASTGLAQQALLDGAAVEGPCASTFPATIQFAPLEKLRRWVAFPLVSHERVLGVLAVSPRNIRGFASEDREMLEIVAGHVALAMENFQIFENVRRMAQTDPLTNVANRRAFDSRLTEEIARAQTLGYSVGLIIVDIDHFKGINDRYGHEAGDAALRAVVAVLRAAVRPSDTVARLGGEEFGVVISNAQPDILQSIAERIRSVVAKTAVQFDDGEFHLTASLGGAMFPRDARDPQELFRIADSALYESKHGGRNRVTFAGVVTRNRQEDSVTGSG